MKFQSIVDYNRCPQDLSTVVRPHQLDMACLKQSADEMMKESPSEQALFVSEPLHDVSIRWGCLLNAIADRQVSGRLQDACGAVA